MLESLDFHYDGISSKDMGLLNVRTDSGLFEELFLPNRSIKTFKVKGNDKSYLQGIERENISIPLTFFLPDGYTNEQLRSITRWFNQEYYKPFFFDEFPDRIFYFMYQGDSRIFHNGMNQGYFTIELVSNSSYSYSPVYLSPPIVVNDTVNGLEYEFINNGDSTIMPEIWIKNNGNSNVKIHNLSNGVKFEFAGIALSETIYIDNEKEDIVSDLPLTYRYDNFNGEYLELIRGVNRLKIYGICEIEFRYRFTLLA